jgi:hypothetical protein
VINADTPLPAGFSTASCVTVSCRTCSKDFGDDEIGGNFHFEGLDEAVKHLREANWWYTQDGAQCPACGANEACATVGHAWEPWRTCGCRGAISSHVVPMEYRDCASCQATEERPVAPAG